MNNRGKQTRQTAVEDRERVILEDPVTAFWLNMARTARTAGLRRLHAHLAFQRADFLANRLRTEQEKVTA